MLVLSLVAIAVGVGTEPSKGEIEAKALNIAETFATEDYPKEAAAKDVSGGVGVRVKVSANGQALSCRVTEPSGSDLLDQQTCDVLMARGRFEPGKDKWGRAVAADAPIRVLWALPAIQLTDITTFNRFTLGVGPEGQIRQCRSESEASGRVFATKTGDDCRKAIGQVPTESIIFWRRGSKLHDTTLVMEMRASLDANSPMIPIGRGPGDRLVEALTVRMHFDATGKGTSCEVTERMIQRPDPRDPCTVSLPRFARFAAAQRSPLDVRVSTGIYLQDEPN